MNRERIHSLLREREFKKHFHAPAQRSAEFLFTASFMKFETLHTFRGPGTSYGLVSIVQPVPPTHIKMDIYN
jgi:hypothetical protein